MLSRRDFLTRVAAGAAATAIGCGDGATSPIGEDPSRIRISPTKPTRTPKLGIQPLGLTPPPPALQRDGLLYVPTTYKSSEALPLVVMLHGSSGSSADWFGSFAQRAETARVVMLAPDSRESTWDVIEDGAFGSDVTFIETAIALAFDLVSIDANRLALFGFSDGASYALSLALANGDNFRHVVACSPGGIPPAPPHDKPDIYIAHGTADAVLPIDLTSRVIVSELRAAGYTVTYTEFNGGHELPPTVADGAMAWLSTAFGQR